MVVRRRYAARLFIYSQSSARDGRPQGGSPTARWHQSGQQIAQSDTLNLPGDSLARRFGRLCTTSDRPDRAPDFATAVLARPRLATYGPHSPALGENDRTRASCYGGDSDHSCPVRSYLPQAFARNSEPLDSPGCSTLGLYFDVCLLLREGRTRDRVVLVETDAVECDR